MYYLVQRVALSSSYREYDLYGYTKQWNNQKHTLAIGALVSQKLAKWVFEAVETYRKGLRGKPRLKAIPRHP